MYFHVAAVAVSCVFSLVDTRVIQIPRAVIDLLQWFVLPIIAALLICPVAILICTLRSSLSSEKRLFVLSLETMVFFAHLYCLVPAIQ
ncbi:hypothetical protein CKO51_08460 [Rhodopirellula sp. SM50]|nr:hypothetical protein CKO51_08460 [Rhodopirellula sp. SM50]